MQEGVLPFAVSGRVGSLWIYPIKSLDGARVDSAGFTRSGSLFNDRRFCLMDANGRLINGKRTPAIHRIRSVFHFESMQVSMRTDADVEVTCFNLEAGNRFLEEYLGQQLSQKVVIKEDDCSGFLDDPETASVTLASQATLQRVANWFGWQDPSEALNRFRPNVVIDGIKAFAEDQLAAQPDAGMEFQLGEVTFNARRLCTRCVVPTRNPTNGEATRFLQSDFVRSRVEESLGSKINVAYGHAYLLSVCCIPSGDFNGKQLKVGDGFTC